MASCILQAVQNYRRAVGPPPGTVVARVGAEPRVETNAPRLRASPSTNDGAEPVVVIPRTSGAN